MFLVLVCRWNTKFNLVMAHSTSSFSGCDACLQLPAHLFSCLPACQLSRAFKTRVHRRECPGLQKPPAPLGSYLNSSMHVHDRASDICSPVQLPEPMRLPAHMFSCLLPNQLLRPASADTPPHLCMDPCEYLAPRSYCTNDSLLLTTFCIGHAGGLHATGPQNVGNAEDQLGTRGFCGQLQVGD